MLLRSAFHGEVRGNWFLSADVSGVQTCHSNKNSSKLNNTSNGMKMGVPNDDDNCRGLLPDINRIQALPMLLANGATEKTIVSEMIDGIRFEKTVEKTIDFQRKKISEEKCSRPRKKCKMSETRDECQNRNSGDACTLFQASGKDTSKPEIVSCANLMADSIKESPGGGSILERNEKSFSGATAEVSVVRYDHFEGTSTRTTEEKSNLRNTMTSQNLLASDETKQVNLLGGKMDDELAQDAPTKPSDGVSVDVPNRVTRWTDAGGGVREINPDECMRKRKKKKKKKVLTIAGKFQDTTNMEHTGKCETMKTCSETLKSDLNEEENGLFLEKNRGVVMPSNNQASDHVDPVSMLKESSFSRDVDKVMEPEIPSGIVKKKKKKGTRQKNIGIDQTDNCITSSSGLLLPSTDHIPEETDKGEGITHHDEKDVQILLDSSTLDARKKGQGVNRNEVADSVILTQTEQASEDGVSVKKNADKSTQSSSANCHGEIHSVETEDPVMEFSKVDKGSENTGNKDRKASKKRKKQKLTEAEVQVNFPGEDQQVGVDALSTKETSISVENSEQKVRQVESSQVLYSKIEEKSNKIHGIAENTHDLKTTSEKGGEGINFKQYFVPGQDHHKEDYVDKVKKAIRLKMETPIRVKDNDLPSVSNSAELQNSFKSLVNKRLKSDLDVTKLIPMKTPKKSLLLKSGSIFQKNSDESSGDENGTIHKPGVSLAASSFINKKCQTSAKTSSIRSELLPRKQGNRMMAMKTPQKKSLFTKSGAIFQDNGGESSGDETGALHSDGNTACQSDSSSMSGDSDGGSDLSQDSPRNGTFVINFRFIFALG